MPRRLEPLSSTKAGLSLTRLPPFRSKLPSPEERVDDSSVDTSDTGSALEAAIPEYSPTFSWSSWFTTRRRRNPVAALTCSSNDSVFEVGTSIPSRLGLRRNRDTRPPRFSFPSSPEWSISADLRRKTFPIPLSRVDSKSVVSPSAESRSISAEDSCAGVCIAISSDMTSCDLLRKIPPLRLLDSPWRAGGGPPCSLVPSCDLRRKIPPERNVGGSDAVTLPWDSKSKSSTVDICS
mmetsp:Transcript_18362/g.38375  ORF Transcript_18362/g.38375 Transcript_18362/m.38375 type:complete len:236 (-) Transcript_18362:2828-3535(-)